MKEQGEWKTILPHAQVILKSVSLLSAARKDLTQHKAMKAELPKHNCPKGWVNNFYQKHTMAKRQETKDRDENLTIDKVRQIIKKIQ